MRGYAPDILAPSLHQESLKADCIIVGGGMAGMCAAASAAQSGVNVAVLEAEPVLGGTALVSQGLVWAARDAEAFLEQDPRGDVAAFGHLRDGLESAIEWIRSLGVSVGPLVPDILGYGSGWPVDVSGLMHAAAKAVQRAGGHILRRCEATELLTMTNGAVAGVKMRDVNSGETGIIHGGAVVLATGGFQSDGALLNRYVHHGASEYQLRSARGPWTTGLTLGMSVGAGVSREGAGFYGHLLPVQAKLGSKELFGLVTQYHSEFGILLNKAGRRFVDESQGDHVNAQEVGRFGKCLLVVDESIMRQHVRCASLSGLEAIDRVAEAIRRGAVHRVGGSISELARKVAELGYDAAAVESSINEYNRHVLHSGEPLDVPRRSNRTPLVESPYIGIEVEAAITVPYRGLLIDDQSNVVGEKAAQVVNLYAIGADAGGFNFYGYSGGLGRALVMGRNLAEAMV